MNIMNRLSRQTSRADGKVSNPMPSLEECPELVTIAGSLDVEQPAGSGEQEHNHQQSSLPQVSCLDPATLPVRIHSLNNLSGNRFPSADGILCHEVHFQFEDSVLASTMPAAVYSLQQSSNCRTAEALCIGIVQDDISEGPQMLLVDAEKLDGFPETSHGFKSKVGGQGLKIFHADCCQSKAVCACLLAWDHG